MEEKNKTKKIEDTWEEISWKRFLEIIKRIGFEITFQEEEVLYRAPYGTIYWRTPWTDPSYEWKIREGEDLIDLTVFIAVCNEKKLLLNGAFWPEREGTSLGIFGAVSGRVVPFRRTERHEFLRALQFCTHSFSYKEPRIFKTFRRKAIPTDFSFTTNHGVIRTLRGLAKVGKFVPPKTPAIHFLPLHYYSELSGTEREIKVNQMFQTLPRWTRGTD
ncbi:MAG: hypothetical protein QME61_02545 [Patescibacteria group bacterium]|nr:hypothetical protein [Patescibacteria group bacterium]